MVLSGMGEDVASGVGGSAHRSAVVSWKTQSAKRFDVSGIEGPLSRKRCLGVGIRIIAITDRWIRLGNRNPYPAGPDLSPVLFVLNG